MMQQVVRQLRPQPQHLSRVNPVTKQWSVAIATVETHTLRQWTKAMLMRVGRHVKRPAAVKLQIAGKIKFAAIIVQKIKLATGKRTVSELRQQTGLTIAHGFQIGKELIAALHEAGVEWRIQGAEWRCVT